MCLCIATRNSEQLCLTCLSSQSYDVEVWSEKSFILEKYWSYHTKKDLILKGNIFSFQKNAKTIKKMVGCYALESIL